MKRTTCVALGAFLLASGLALAQKTPNVAQVGIWKAKPGAEAALAEGRKKHNEFHKAQKDPWTWLTWEVVNGDHMGELITGSFGHYWKDFDGNEKFDALDGADIAKNIGPSGAITRLSYYVALDKASRPVPGATTPSNYSQVTFFYVKPGDIERFENALEAIKTAQDKINWPAHSRWYRLASGGEGPEYVLSTARDSFAAFAPPEKTLTEGLTEAVGARQATSLLDDLRGSTHHTYSEILKYRADLSYVPAAGK